MVIAFSSAVLASCGGGTILRRQGGVWKPFGGAGGGGYSDIAGISADDAWIVGSDGVILRWDGRTWTSEASGTLSV